MSAEQIRETLQQYLEVLLARGSYGRFFDDDTEFALMGTDQQTHWCHTRALSARAPSASRPSGGAANRAGSTSCA